WSDYIIKNSENLRQCFGKTHGKTICRKSIPRRPDLFGIRIPTNQVPQGGIINQQEAERTITTPQMKDSGFQWKFFQQLMVNGFMAPEISPKFPTDIRGFIYVIKIQFIMKI